MAAIGIAKKGLGLLGKKLKKKPKKKSPSGTVKGAKDYVPYLKRSGKERAAEYSIPHREETIERIRKLPESIGGKGIKDFGKGKK